MPTRIVIADDEWLMTLLLKTELERQGYEVIGIAGSGREVLSLCCEKTPDVVMMDIQMPGMDGLAVTRVLMEKCPMCVVIVTGKGLQEQAAEQAGAMSCVTKPLFGDHVASVVETARRWFQQFLEVRAQAVDFNDMMVKWRQVRKAVLLLMQQERISEEASLAKLQ